MAHTGNGVIKREGGVRRKGERSASSHLSAAADRNPEDTEHAHAVDLFLRTTKLLFTYTYGVAAPQLVQGGRPWTCLSWLPYTPPPQAEVQRKAT